MIRYFLLAFILLGLLSCRPKIEKRFISQLKLTPQEYNDTGTTRLPNAPKKKVSNCKDKSAHIPDPDHLEFTPVKYVKVISTSCGIPKVGAIFPTKTMDEPTFVPC